METALLVLHIVVSLFLVFIVLIQGGKGAELGAAFGAGSSQTIFGGRGAATFLNKITTLVAVLFMVTSLLLAIVSTKGGSVVKKTIPAAERQGTIPTGTPEIPSDIPTPAPGQAPGQTPGPAQGQTPVQSPSAPPAE